MHPAIGFFLDKVLPGLIGTGVGAWLAFWSKRRMDAGDEIKKQKAAANYAMFVLQRHVNELVCLERELNAWRPDATKNRRWLEMLPLHQYAELPQLQIEGLSWMIQKSDPNLLARLMVARDKMLTVHGSLELRRQVKQRVNDHLEDKTKDMVFPAGTVSSEFLFAILTNRQIVELQLSADGLLESVADALHFNFEIATELHQAFRKLWPDPKVRIIHLEPKEVLLKRENLELPCPSNTPSTASTKA